jgi:Raf kinase inhibitor-like YbhB/YbcL family protein
MIKLIFIFLLIFQTLLFGGDKMALHIYSSAFADGENIPAKYTCDGSDINPPLAWNGVKEGVRSLVLIVDDPDAPDPHAPKMTWVHWVLYNISPNVIGLQENVKSLLSGTMEGLNDWKRVGYGGPCPPIGHHRYFFKLYALDTQLNFSHLPTKAEVEEAMQGHIIQAAELVGLYQKQSN